MSVLSMRRDTCIVGQISINSESARSWRLTLLCASCWTCDREWKLHLPSLRWYFPVTPFPGAPEVWSTLFPSLDCDINRTLRFEETRDWISIGLTFKWTWKQQHKWILRHPDILTLKIYVLSDLVLIHAAIEVSHYLIREEQLLRLASPRL